MSRSYITRVLEAQKQEPFLVEVSAHHIHLTQEHVEALFGKGHQLTRHADLSQPGQYACKEQLTIVGPKGRIERVRVLGPTRKYTQVEIAMTEQFKLGVHPPIRERGDIADTPGCTLEGTAGSVKLDRGVICALRHVHMTPEDALRYGVRDKSVVRVRIDGDRELIFGDVLVRVTRITRSRCTSIRMKPTPPTCKTGATGLHRRNPKCRTYEHNHKTESPFEQPTEAWRGFKPGLWQRDINVRWFLQQNYTPYDGDGAFLRRATERTKRLWKQLEGLFVEERKKGVLDVSQIPSSITAHAPGYIDQENEVIVGLQTDAPLKRAIMPNGGLAHGAQFAQGLRLRAGPGGRRGLHQISQDPQ